MIPDVSTYHLGDYITAFRTADFCGAVFFRRALFGVCGLREPLIALPTWNRTASPAKSLV